MVAFGHKTDSIRAAALLLLSNKCSSSNKIHRNGPFNQLVSVLILLYIPCSVEGCIIRAYNMLMFTKHRNRV